MKYDNSNPHFIETMTTLLTEKWLSLGLFNEYTNNDGVAEKHANEIDQLIQYHLPSVDKCFRRSNISSMSFVFRFEFVFFADEHKADDILRIFDFILVNRSDIINILKCLILAHLEQVDQLYQEEDKFLTRFSRNKNWEVTSLIERANYFKDHMNIFPWKPVIIGAAIGIGALITLGLVIFKRTRK